MDLTDRLLQREQQHKPAYQWPAVAFTAGAVAGAVLAIGVVSLGVETDRPVAGDPLLHSRLYVDLGSRRLFERESTDLHALERQMNQFSWGLTAAGMVGGGLTGLAAVGAARRAFYKLAGPDGLV